MADGSVKIDVGLNLSKAEKDLEKLKDKIRDTEKAVNRQTESRNALETKLNAATAAAERTQGRIDDLTQSIKEMEAALHGETGSIEYDPVTFQSLPGDIEVAKKELAKREKLLKEQTKEVNASKREYDSINQKVEEGTEKLTEMKAKAGEMAREIEQARPGKALSEGFEQARKGLLKFLKYAIGIRSVYFLFRRLRSAISESFKAFAEYDQETKKNVQNLKDALATLKAAWGGVFASIYNAIAPILQNIIGWLVDAANAASRFIAIISGRPTFKKAVMNANNVAQSLDNVAESAQEAQKQLMGFDELNVLNDTTSRNGSAANKATNPGYSLVEEAIDAYDGTFLNNLAITVKDVLFDWSDLNPEQIAKKVIAGLGGLLGLALGITLGMGPGGVLLMTLAGVGLGLIIDTLLFDNDGKLSEREILDMILLAINGIVGGVIGFAITHSLKGALIGATIGVGLTLAFKAIEAKGDVKTNNILSAIKTIITAATGGLIGWMAGSIMGPFGQVLGAVIGISLAVGIRELVMDEQSRYASKEAFYNSDFGRQVQALKDQINEMLEADADLRVRINSITGELDSATIAEFSAAQQLIDDIFTLDAEDNKTAQQLEELKTKIEMLNSMNLGNLQITFDETTGHVVQTREEIQGMMGDLLQQYQLEAMKSAYIDSFREQYEATNEVKTATETATSAAQAYDTAMTNLDQAQRNYNSALAEYKQYESEITSSGSGSGLSEKAQEVANKFTEAKAALDKAKTAAEETKTAMELSAEGLETAMQTYEIAGQKVDEIGQKITDLAGTAKEEGTNISTGMADGITQSADVPAKSAMEMAQETLDSLRTALESHSPSKMTIQEGENFTGGLAEGIRNGANEAINAAKEVADKTVETVQDTDTKIKDDIGSTWDQVKSSTVQIIQQMAGQVNSMFEKIHSDISSNLERIKALMNFEWSIPRPKIPVITWYYNYVQSGDGSTFAIPQFNVHWAAKGGIFDVATLIGVGEDGKEAVVPLENNTEWITLVANGLMDSIAKSDFPNQLAQALMNVPMPAMAGGGIAPPNAFYGRFGNDWGDTLMAELEALKSEISALSRRPIEVDSTMYLDKREIGRAVTKFQREQERVWG